MTRFSVKIDLHVHTAKGSPCAESHDPSSIPETMEKIGLNGLVITEHNYLWDKKDIDLLNINLYRKKIYRGMELSSGRNHYIIIGITDAKNLYAGIPPLEMSSIVKDKGGVIILAHPFYGINGNQYPEIQQGVSAIEIMSTITSACETEKAKNLSNKFNITQVAGSDAHCSKKIGDFFTVFPHLPENEEELAEMIRKGNCCPDTILK